MTLFVRKSRFCRRFDGANYFKPKGIPLSDLQVNDLALDELEAMHLCDFEELEQKTAAEKMKVSTSTLQRLLYSGRKKVIDALYSSKALKISKYDNIKEYMPPLNVDRKYKRSGCSKDSTEISKRGVMKICITSSGDTLESQIDPRFGRCLYFIIYDNVNGTFEAIANPNVDVGSGAGIQSAQLVIAKQASMVITGEVGPKAEQVLKNANIQIITNKNGSVMGAIKNI